MATCARPRPAGPPRRGGEHRVLLAWRCLPRGLRPGGGAVPAGPSGTRIARCTADGDRTAIVHHGASAAAGAPLVVVLHGARGTAADMRANLGWDALADREGLVVAYPDGLDRTWNAGGCCGPARDRGVDDVGFLDALVATLRRDDAVGAVYAVGFSNGAMMSYAWACARPGALAGIGPVAGALTVDCPAPAPLTVVAVHGTRDERVPIGGGRGPSGVDFPVAGRLARAVPDRRRMPDDRAVGRRRPRPGRRAGVRRPRRGERRRRRAAARLARCGARARAGRTGRWTRPASCGRTCAGEGAQIIRRMTRRGSLLATASVLPTTSNPAFSNIARVPTNAIVRSIRPAPGSTG